MHPPSYHRNDPGTRASYLYDGDDKTNGATTASSTDEAYSNSPSRTRREPHSAMQQQRKDECAGMEAVEKKG